MSVGINKGIYSSLLVANFQSNLTKEAAFGLNQCIEIQKIMEGTDISAEKPCVIYETLEWTEKLQESYKAWLKKYANYK